MRRSNLCFLGFIIGLIGFAFIPIPSFKFFAFIIPLFLLSMALSSDQDYINMNLFMVCLFVMLLFSSTFITMDVAADPITNVRAPIQDPNAGGGFSIVAFLNQVTTSLSVITVILIVGVPVILAVGVVWAFLKGRVSEAATGFVRVIVLVGVMLMVFGVFNMMNFDPFGITTGVTETYIAIANFVITLPASIYGGASDLVSEIGVDLPDIGVNPDVTFDVVIQTFDSMSYTEIMYAVNDALPMLMSLLCLIVGFSMIRKKWEDSLVEALSKPLFEEEKKDVKREFYPSMNRKMLVFVIFIVVSAFGIFLSYSNVYPEAEDQQNYMFIGYFSVYLFMSIIPLIFLSMENNLYYRRSTFITTVKGVIYGIGGLFLMTRFFFQEIVMSAFSVASYNQEVSYIINQLIFVAPSESIMFHIFIPSVFASFVMVKTAKVLKRGYELDRNTELAILDAKKEMLTRLEVFYKRTKKTIEELAEVEKELNSINTEIRTLSNEEALLEVDFKSVFGRVNSLYIFIIGCVVSNFIFSIMHWIVLIPQGVDFFLFWTCGLGVIYLAGGFWFTFIAYRFGWVACILTHAIYNSQTLIVAMILFGGV